MKKIVPFLMVMVMGLSGCVSAEVTEEAAPESFITAEEIREYSELIEDTFNSFYWHYDEETVEFEKGTVPKKDTDFGKAVAGASKDAGFDIGRFGGDEMICAVVTLQHYNGNAAGVARLFLDGGEVKGVYYSPLYDAGKAYSLNDRNIFTAEADFTAFESEAPLQEFDGISINYLKNGFSSSGDAGYGRFMAAVTDGESAVCYTLWGKDVAAMDVETEEGLVVMDCAVSGKEDGLDRIAVLAGRKNASGDDAESRIMPEKVVLLDKNGNTLGQIDGNGKGITFVDIDNGYILIGHDGFVDFYRGGEREKSVYTGIDITALKKCDFDGDGRDEYAITDGLDVYICRMEGTSFDILWRTNISSKFFNGDLYTGDLNADGVSELYLVDQSGFGMKYVLTEKGFKYEAAGENGNAWYVADFDFDGKSDYIEATNEPSLPAKMYVAK